MEEIDEEIVICNLCSIMTIRSVRKRWSVIFTALLNGAKMKFAISYYSGNFRTNIAVKIQIGRENVERQS